MKTYKTNDGIFNSEVDFQNFKPKNRELTIEDFDGSQVRYNIYLENMKSLKINQERFDTKTSKVNELSENNKYSDKE